jgi:bifunctional UDP-N-acetylglucosamine pyrophosphorylase/glucosamine-1-phosphate N-acetyltransferase
MDCIIMAAGKGTRLRPLTDTTPKPLIPVAGKPTLIRLLEQLPSSVDRLILVIGYLGDQIRAAVGETWHGMPVAYVVQDPLDGTGGALRRAEPFIQSEKFLVINADDLYRKEDLEALCALDRGLLVSNQVLHKTSDVCLVENGVLAGFVSREAGETGAVNVGAYVLGREWFATEPVLVPKKTDEWSLPHSLPQLFGKVTLQVVPTTFWMMCGTHEELAAATAELTKRGWA